MLLAALRNYCWPLFNTMTALPLFEATRDVKICRFYIVFCLHNLYPSQVLEMRIKQNHSVALIK